MSEKGSINKESAASTSVDDAHGVEDTKAPEKIYFGFLLIVLSSLAISIVSVCGKYLANHDASPFEVSFSRMTGQLLLSVALSINAYFHRDDPNQTLRAMVGFELNWDLFYLILNGIFYVMSATLFQVSLNTLNLADASVIYFTMPVWTAFAGLIFLDERLNRFQMVGIFLSIIGVIMDARPGSIFGDKIGHKNSKSDVVGIMLCLGGSISGALYTVTVRKVAKKYKSFVVAMYPGIVGCIVLPIILFLTPLSKDLINPIESIETLLAFVGCGLFTAVSQILLNYGLKFEAAAIAGLIRTLDIVFNAIWSAVLFHNLDTWFSYLGIMLVFLSCIVIGYDKYRIKKQHKHNRETQPLINQKK